MLTRRLIEFVLLPGGAEMYCTSCLIPRPLRSGDEPLERQILLFQEEHFACDPQLSSATAASER